MAIANADRPMGLRAVATTNNAPPRLSPAKSAGSAIIYPGDLLYKNGSGRLVTITTTSQNPVAVSNSYAAAVADTVISVFDDFVNTIFEIQADGADLTDDTQIGGFFDVLITTGDTVTRQGKQELDSDASAKDHFILRGLADRPGNAWGEFAKVLIKVRVDANANVIATT